MGLGVADHLGSCHDFSSRYSLAYIKYLGTITA